MVIFEPMGAERLAEIEQFHCDNPIVRELVIEVMELRTALLWYADPRHYDEEGVPGIGSVYHDGTEYDYEADAGDIARRALHMRLVTVIENDHRDWARSEANAVEYVRTHWSEDDARFAGYRIHVLSAPNYLTKDARLYYNQADLGLIECRDWSGTHSYSWRLQGDSTREWREWWEAAFDLANERGLLDVNAHRPHHSQR